MGSIPIYSNQITLGNMLLKFNQISVATLHALNYVNCIQYLSKTIANNNLLLDEIKRSWDFKVLPFIKKTPILEKKSKTWSTKMHNKILMPFIKVPRQKIYTPQIKKPKQNIEFKMKVSSCKTLNFDCPILF
jgi:hypothetical protein